jgi:hypothetical protein
LGSNVSLSASFRQGSPAPCQRTHGRQHATLSKSRSQPALLTPAPAATLFLDAFALRGTVAMKATGTSIPKQFKAPIGSKKVRRKRTREKAWPKEPEEPIKARVPASPRPKALCPYTPSTRIEETHLRSLIHYCKSRGPYYQYARLINPTDVTFVTATTLTNVGPRFEWYGLAVRDEAFFHAVISSTAAHYSYLTGIELPYKWIFFRHRGEAIRIVNQRIAEGAHDEGTINAIVVFAQQEVGKRGIGGLGEADRDVEFRGTPRRSQETHRGARPTCTSCRWNTFSRIQRENSPPFVIVS